MKILVTGAVGFIAFHLIDILLRRGDEVVGIDNINDYYPRELKLRRLEVLRKKGLRFQQMDISDREALPELFRKEHFDCVVNLAAQAGVRYSIENPWAYVNSNLVGFMNVLECCRHYPVGQLVYASSSSVYGGNEKTPFSEDDRVDNPVSLYAATKKSDELLASAYCSLYGIKATGLRFFTVYGPWGRPDMAPSLFAKAIDRGEPIKAFNGGQMRRDFTYVGDIAEGVVRVIDKPQDKHQVYNIGCGSPVMLMDFISEIEQALGRKAEKIMLPMQKGDVVQTYADTTKLQRDFGYQPKVTLHDGIGEFIKWYKSDNNPLR